MSVFISQKVCSKRAVTKGPAGPSKKARVVEGSSNQNNANAAEAPNLSQPEEQPNSSQPDITFLSDFATPADFLQ